MEGTAIGNAADFTAFPAAVTVGNQSYYLIRTSEGGFRLLSRICPHAGYEVEAEGGGFFCYAHGWAFDGESGKCLNAPRQLAAYEVEERDGTLFAQLP